jgi:hypothetical protein
MKIALLRAWKDDVGGGDVISIKEESVGFYLALIVLNGDVRFKKLGGQRHWIVREFLQGLISDVSNLGDLFLVQRRCAAKMRECSNIDNSTGPTINLNSIPAPTCPSLQSLDSFGDT